MKNSILLIALVTIFAIGCSSDPCDDLDNIECETGDVDGDGVLNGADIAPEDPCLPNDNSACQTGDIDGDGVINSEDSNPEDPCLPNDNIACTTGDVDGDGIINSEDSDPEDPCLPDDNIACPTGDLDGDGVINSEDEDPFDMCVPNQPSFEQNVIGKWSWSTFGGSGALEINQDGTYVETSGDILSNGNVVERKWSVEDGNTLVLRVKNDVGLNANINLELISYDCDEIIFVGFISDLKFTRQ